MFDSGRSARGILAAAIAVLALHASAAAQSSGDTNQSRVVQRFVKAAYPELMGLNLVAFLTTDGAFDLNWDSPTVWVRVRTGYLNAESVLEGHAELRPKEAMINYASFNGPHVSTKESRALFEALKSNARPEPTDDDVRTLLEEAGAQYGPKQRAAFLEQLKIDRFSQVLGRIERFNADFLWRLPDGRCVIEPRCYIQEPEWLVSITTRDDRKRRRCYILHFEPFNGRLKSFGLAECDWVSARGWMHQDAPEPKH